MTFQRLLYTLLLAALNVFGLMMVGIVFLGASNANGEGAPVQSTFIIFLKQLSYVTIVSLFFSFVALLLTRLFRNCLPRNNPFIKNIFWLHLGGLIIIFILSYAYLLIIT